MSTKLKYAMIGGGAKSFIGPIHRMALRLDDLADLVDGCYSHTDDWRALIARQKGKIDFLVVCTPNDSHYEITKAAFDAGMDVFCEKPLSLKACEAIDLAARAQAMGRMLAVPFTYLGYPMVMLARDLVQKGELGKVERITMEYVQGSFRKVDFTKPLDVRTAWKMNPEKAGPSCVVADIGVHAFTLVEWITGLETESVLADFSSYSPGNRLEDDASVLLRLQDRAKATLILSKVATGEENGVRLRIYGTKRSLFWNQERPNELTLKEPFGPDRVYRRNAPYVGALSDEAAIYSRFPAGHPEGFVEALANIYRGFCKALKTRQYGGFPGAREGVRAMQFVDATIASAKRESAWVKFSC